MEAVYASPPCPIAVARLEPALHHLWYWAGVPALQMVC